MSFGPSANRCADSSSPSAPSPTDLTLRRKRQQIVSRLKSLPPLPASAEEVLSIVSDDPRNMVHLEHTIRHDPALTSQLLRVANCAAYAPRTPIDTVHRAIVYLGFSEVRNIALGLSIFGVFKSRRAIKDLDIEALYTHAIGTAIIARLLAVEMGKEDTEVFFAAGLLHDVGRMAIARCFPQAWKQILKTAEAEKCPLIVAEREIELSHNAIGAWLASSWGLPDIHANAIATHHLSVTHPRATQTGILIQLADDICHRNGMGMCRPPNVIRLALLQSLGLSQALVEYLEEQLNRIGNIAQTVTGISGD
jgi:putative nucleotidyltransferase with HDIG domain